MEAWIVPLLSPCPRPAFGPVAQQQSRLHQLSKEGCESFLVSHALRLPICSTPSISSFLTVPPPFCPHTSPKSLPVFLDVFHSLWFAAKQLFESLRFSCTGVTEKHGISLWFYNEDSFTGINSPLQPFLFQLNAIFSHGKFSFIQV